MNSKLTKTQQKAICSQLGNVEMKLLYKASIHGFTGAAFHQHCDNKSPTVSVGYNKSGYVFGGYTRQPFSQSGEWVEDEEAFLFFLGGEKLNMYRVNNVPYAIKMTKNSGPNFGDAFVLVHESKPKVHSNPGSFISRLFDNNSYNFSADKLHGNDLNLTECEVYQLEETQGKEMKGKPDPKAPRPQVVDPSLENGEFENAWRTIIWDPETRKELMESIKFYKPLNSSVTQARVLLVGPVGAGKSSFFNSINSVYRGHVTSQAMAGTSFTSLTTRFRRYFVKAGREGRPLPIHICDTMGLEEIQEGGLNPDDISNIVNGHIPNRYQFNSSAPLQPEACGFNKNPGLKDKIHCVTYIIDASKISIMPKNMEKKLKTIREKVTSSGIPQLVLLTKIDEACPLVKKDIRNVYKSTYIKSLMQEAATRIGVPLSCIVPIKNYSEELDLDMNIDILLLNAVVQMLRFVDNYIDDISD